MVTKYKGDREQLTCWVKKETKKAINDALAHARILDGEGAPQSIADLVQQAVDREVVRYAERFQRR